MKKLAGYSKMQESLEVSLPSKQEEDEEEEDEEEEEEEEEKDQPAEMEYLNSRCVLFTYFQGDIGSVVDEHFSRALGQASNFHPEPAISKNKMGLSPLWRDSSTLPGQRSGFPTSFWTSSYQPPPGPCLGGGHHDFPSPTPSSFPTAEPSCWPGPSLHQTAPPPAPAGSEPWPYPLASQVSPSYSHMHEVYVHHHHPHPHMHHRHHHHHHTPPAGSHLDPRYGSLLMPSVRAARISAPQCDIKTDPTTATTATSAWAGAFHGTVDIGPGFGFDTGLQHQDKSKEAPWF
ncbi:transcription cofactor vestigial-like protein 3 isoform X1 [Tachyglossus aculeatus]|uniref:transcription cofactor vestigial-like protein 3 isoform X1 n=1 Tax=Tachyglossus aculeatus TaxID=9261 RepID=UPI0018F57DA4|nr:transcription cofactor vestigial-like protein 3 isoform X1 [Tachyglossus aculeatus]XP_038622293.1 transcription cofactor vestigial-like protein 3 isoform X1 [Tachyglossus aculeatus]